MSRSLIGASVAVGTGYTTLFQMPANFEGFISSIVAYNSTGGPLNLTIAIKRAGVDVVVLSTDAVSAGATNQYSRGATKPICPLTLLTGDTLEALGSSTGITVTASGLRFSLST